MSLGLMCGDGGSILQTLLLTVIKTLNRRDVICGAEVLLRSTASVTCSRGFVQLSSGGTNGARGDSFAFMKVVEEQVCFLCELK